MAKTKVIKDTSERWLLTYADLMNLLLIFFIILYATSQTDQTKYEQLAESLSTAFGYTAAKKIVSNGGSMNSIISLDTTAPSSVIPSKLEDEQMAKLEENVNKIIQKEGLTGSVEVSMQERGIVISIKEKALFKSGSADIEPESVPTIEKIGKALNLLSGKQIRIEGHTDNDAIRTSRFPDNQELSTARANSVWRILVKNVGLDPKLMAAIGYGEQRPKVENTSEANKAQNRRVDIAILKDKFDASEAGILEQFGLTTDVQPTPAAGEDSAAGGETTTP